MAPRRLAILVPYRDRASHLALFLPHVTRYLYASPLAGSYVVHVVEQLGAARFNKGRLLNGGFRLACDSADYVVFHDVDYLPIHADYSYCPRPTRLIWKGLLLPESYTTFFGAVVGFPVEDFEAVNGFSNDYWGWGCEDVDLRFRVECASKSIDRRDGTFRALPHPHRGFVTPGVLNAEARATHALLRGRLHDFPSYARRDGLSTLRSSPAWTRTMAGVGGGRVLHHGFHL